MQPKSINLAASVAWSMWVTYNLFLHFVLNHKQFCYDFINNLKTKTFVIFENHSLLAEQLFKKYKPIKEVLQNYCFVFFNGKKESFDLTQIKKFMEKNESMVKYNQLHVNFNLSHKLNTENIINQKNGLIQLLNIPC